MNWGHIGSDEFKRTRRRKIPEKLGYCDFKYSNRVPYSLSSKNQDSKNYSADSRIVLGGAAFQSMGMPAISRLLESSRALKIRSIDTAPLYGHSEKAIGAILKGDDSFSISTKVGRPLTGPFTREALHFSIEKSLKALNRDMVDCIFIHSLSPRLLSDSVYDALEDLKKSGVTRKIGVSADNEDLSYFRQLSIFDSYMATLNLVDQRNLSQIKLLVEKKDLEVTIKRALANAAWTQKRIPNLKNMVKNLGKTRNKDDTQSYPFRHKFLSSVSEQHLNGWMYMQYSLSWNTSAKVLIGTSRISHLQLFRDIEREKRLVAEEIEAIENLWKLGQLYDWKAIV